MKAIFKLGILFLLGSLTLIPSCDLFEFRERCKDTKEVFTDKILQEGQYAWGDHQRNIFYSNIENGRVLFSWNTGVSFDVCVQNNVTAKIQVVLHKSDEDIPEVKIIMTNYAALEKEEIRIARLKEDFREELSFSEIIALDFNRTDDDPLYGSTNVETRISYPLPADFIDTPENQQSEIEWIERLVKEINVQIDYVY